MRPTSRANAKSNRRSNGLAGACRADASDDIDQLLRRMREGDREAAAIFITQFDSRIRRRIRGKLNPAMRRLFDSQDILSTVGRRLDQYVRSGSLEAASERQLWALVFKMAANAVVDKSRMFRRLQQVEGPDGRIAQEMLRQLRSADQQASGGVEIELDNVLGMFRDETDREILILWLNGFRLQEIATSIDMAATGVRKRWQKIREQLQVRFKERLDSRS